MAAALPLARVEDTMLTDQELRLVEAIATLGMSQRVAAQYAGYASYGAVQAALNRPLVVQAIADTRAANAEVLNITRDKMHLGLHEAIELARIMGDPASMIRGWRERGLISGFYDESPDARRGVTDLQKKAMDRVKEMTDEDLIALTAKKVEGITIDQVRESDGQGQAHAERSEGAEAWAEKAEGAEHGRPGRSNARAQESSESSVPGRAPRRDQPKAARAVPPAQARTKAQAKPTLVVKARRAGKPGASRKVSARS